MTDTCREISRLMTKGQKSFNNTKIEKTIKYTTFNKAEMTYICCSFISIYPIFHPAPYTFGLLEKKKKTLKIGTFADFNGVIFQSVGVCTLQSFNVVSEPLC